MIAKSWTYSATAEVTSAKQIKNFGVILSRNVMSDLASLIYLIRESGSLIPLIKLTFSMHSSRKSFLPPVPPFALPQQSLVALLTKSTALQLTIRAPSNFC